MNRKDIRDELEARLPEVGINPKCMSVRHVPAAVEATVLIKGLAYNIRLSSGATRADLDREIGRIEGLYRQRALDGQIDIEDLIKEMA